MQDLEKLLKILIVSPLDFVVIGGFAAVLHGCDQSTRDVDICLVLSPENVQNLRAILAPLHPKIRTSKEKLSFLEHPHQLNNLTNLHLETDFGILDLVSHVQAVGDYYDVLKNAKTIQLYGHECHLIDIDDLIRCKKSLAGHRDLAVAEELEAIKNERDEIP